MSGHTPLPWRVTDNADVYRNVEPVAIEGAGKFQTVACNNTYYPTAISKEDAELIVHRVNVFDTLIKALDDIVEMAPIGSHARVTAQIAIAKARGQS